ncbi:GNAT family N-acetyltransferase [Paracoccus sp. M683]|uniref:GNAT family N-acetyltransferase n=1 Tax=Paracoccus sp. M683 TaxID=2594268 RepID=UPI00117F828E|nr:GNAT family N-acetyltransferase [Paracoccus sp. M683]TRW98671.1 GNAT family N-acetyltransferase [Paracoccus sp. M683]
MTDLHIRPLDPVADLPLVTAFYADAPDFWLLAEGAAPGPAKAQEFFDDCPPGSDPEASHRLGLFLGDRLSGLAELSFAFPRPEDAYLGLMILGPWAQGAGNGRRFLAHVEALARQADCPSLYLGVLDRNPRGRAFWEREGFAATGDWRRTEQGDHVFRMVKPL